MKIATVTLNPAVDQTVSVDDFRTGVVNRSRGMRVDAGGKGVNVASFLADYGLQVAVTGFLGEENAELFERHFTRKKIADHFIRVPGETRVNIKIMDELNRETTDLNTAGQAPGEYAVTRLSEQVEALAEACEWVILSGNLPPGLVSDFYIGLIQIIKQQGRKVVLDTSGDALLAGVQAGPWMVKPNIDELRQLTGRELKTVSEVYKAAAALLSNDVQVVVVSMGAEGSLLVTQAQALLAVPPAVALKSTVGAGDAMVAGLVAGFAQKFELAGCARLGTAFSLSAITRLGRDLSPRPELEAFGKQVTVTSFVLE